MTTYQTKLLIILRETFSCEMDTTGTNFVVMGDLSAYGFLRTRITSNLY